MKLATCNEMFEGWSWERIVSFCAEVGYQGLEVAPYTIADHAAGVTAEKRRELRRVAESAGVPVIGLHWLLVKPPGLYLTHPDPAVRRKTSDYFVDLVRLCADLGGYVMVLGSPKQRSLLPGVSRSQAFGYVREVFEPVLPVAEKCKVTLGFEPLTPKETNFINTAAEGMELADSIHHPNFRLNLDVKAMSGGETRPIPDVIRASARYIAHVQVNDPNMLGPGMGDVDHRPIIKALKEVGYDGYLSVEAFDYAPGPERIAKESIAYLKKVLQET